MKLPPYGYVDENLKRAKGQRPMPDWSGTQEQYHACFESLLDEISQHIWPVYDRKAGKWVGCSKSFMKRATRRELQFMIRAYQKQSILHSMPNYAAGVPKAYRKTHMWHFLIEDNKQHLAGSNKVTIDSKPVSLVDEVASHHGKLAMNYICYEPSVNPLRFSETFSGAGAGKIDGLFEFKERFQRPRPYQAAMILGEDKFQHHAAANGVHFGAHPSLVSGHCYQGILMSCATLESWINSGEDTPERASRLAHFGVDFGDRRVFAGVHYPTDNIASWIVCLKFIPRIFQHADRILAFAQDAIVNKSVLYKTIRKPYSKDKDLSKSLALLDKYLARLHS